MLPRHLWLPLLLVTLPATPAAAEGPPVPQGMDLASAEALREAGAPPDLGTLWVGRWTMEGGWSYVESALRHAVDVNVTPVVHAYYWGDDIQPDCFDEGCDGKSVEEWDGFLVNLTDTFHEALDGEDVVVVVETEFNKEPVHDWETLDGLLAERIRGIEERYPAARTVLGLGGWWRSDWGTWDRAAAAADLVGVQVMKASTRNDEASYLGSAEILEEHIGRLTELFGKPVFVTDVALSSYPDDTHLALQAGALAAVLAVASDPDVGEVAGIVYRQLQDSPWRSMDDHFGEAERHWGLVHGNGTWKPAMGVWAAWVNPPLREETSTVNGTITNPLVTQSDSRTAPTATDAGTHQEAPAATAAASTTPLLLAGMVVSAGLTLRRRRR